MMITTRRLYIGTGIAMATLILSMLLDAIVPTLDRFWIHAFAHPAVSYIGVVVLVIFAFDRDEVNGTELLFTLTLITLFTVLLNEGLVQVAGSGTLPIGIAALAGLSLIVPAGWTVLGVTSIASILSGDVLLSSVLVSSICGVGLTMLMEGVGDA